jgi:hypothetical protein
MNKFKDLQEFIAKRMPKEFIFWSENQDGYDVADPCKLQLSFKNMLISENPKIIMLKDGCNSIYFTGVKSVKYIENASVLGTVITIVCKNPNASRGDITYTVVAS